MGITVLQLSPVDYRANERVQHALDDINMMYKFNLGWGTRSTPSYFIHCEHGSQYSGLSLWIDNFERGQPNFRATGTCDEDYEVRVIKTGCLWMEGRKCTVREHSM